MKNIEIIERFGKRFVVIPEADYDVLVEDAEMLDDTKHLI